MENGLVQTNFEVETQFFTYPSSFIVPVWAQGFDCFKEKCGFCCLTEKPNEVQGVHHETLNRPICKLYELKQRLCKKYPIRPELCKSYPFFLGVEAGRVIASLNLECPGSNGNKCVPKTKLEDTFNTAYWSRRITLLNDWYEKAVLSPFLWHNAERDRYNISDWVKEFYAMKKCFPYVDKVREIIFQKLNEQNGQNIPEVIPPIPISEISKDLTGAYIATRFESFSLGLLESKGTKLKMLFFDENMSVLKRTQFLAPSCFKELELDKDAHNLLIDYISLLLNRPFTSLAVALSGYNQEQVASNFISGLSGALALLEGSANIIALRDKLTTIDKDTMREIISFCEGNVISGFMRPDIQKYF